MKKHLIVITPSFIDFKNECIKIGGLETYIKDLCNLAMDLGYDTDVYQTDVNAEKIHIEWNNIRIHATKSLSQKKLSNQKAFDLIFSKHNNNNTIFIIATDQLDIKCHKKNVIAIQHGIAFDIPGEMISGFFGKNKYLIHINKILRCIKNINRFYNTYNTVCVDYNYFNWFRTLGIIDSKRTMEVIPNYTSCYIPEDVLKNKLKNIASTKKIVFARRFVDYRGTLLFANVVKRMLNEGKNIEVTFAGNGPLEMNLHSMFKDEEKVSFTSFKSTDSVTFHKEFDIAVIPTIFSEGTSLSLCESMAAGCFPIATHVGGMTNIIIDGYNGYLSYPSENALYEKLNTAISLSNEVYTRIVYNAYKTVKEGLNIQCWKEKWEKVFLDIDNHLNNE